MPTTSEPTAQRSTQRRLSDAERYAIAAMWARTQSVTETANHFNVNRNTVSVIVQSVKAMQDTQNPAESLDWRSKLTNELPRQSVDALQRSIADTQDVHKAASTAIAHLKGIGALQGEGNATITVMLNSVSSLPADLAQDYIEIEATHPPTTGEDVP